MRTVFVSGSAGAGTSSVAAALAVQAAGRGLAVSLLRSDRVPAPLTDPPSGLRVIDVDPLSWGQSTWDAVALLRRFAGPPWSAISGNDILLVPGMPEAAWWGTLRQVWRERPDLVVVDAGPVEAALRWLTLPDTLVGGLRRTWPLPQRTATAAGVLESGSWHLRAMARLDSEAADLADQLRSSATSVHLVVRPARHDLARVLDSLAPLALFELAVTDIVVNHFSGRRRYDEAMVEGLAGRLPGLRIRTAAARRSAPAPHVLAAEAYPQPLPSHKPVRPRLRRSADAYSWRWPVPFADPSGISAMTTGDDAVLTVAGVRRVVPLPSVLRRCVLEQATVDEGVLELRFVPDPDMWPETWELR